MKIFLRFFIIITMVASSCFANAEQRDERFLVYSPSWGLDVQYNSARFFYWASVEDIKSRFHKKTPNFTNDHLMSTRFYRDGDYSQDELIGISKAFLYSAKALEHSFYFEKSSRELIIALRDSNAMDADDAWIALANFPRMADKKNHFYSIVRNSVRVNQFIKSIGRTCFECSHIGSYERGLTGKATMLQRRPLSTSDDMINAFNISFKYGYKFVENPVSYEDDYAYAIAKTIQRTADNVLDNFLHDGIDEGFVLTAKAAADLYIDNYEKLK